MNCIISMKYLKQINGTVNITKTYHEIAGTKNTQQRFNTFRKEEIRKGQTKPCHHPPPPTTIYYHLPTAKIYPPPPTTSLLTITHYHPPPAKIYPPPPTTSQKTSTTTYNFPKNGPPPHKSQNISIYIFFWHCCNSFLFLEMKYSFPSWRFCVTKF